MIGVDITKYIGREYEKYNCFDLVKEFYKDFYELDLQNYFEGKVPDRKTIECLVKTNRGDFKRVNTAKFGDIVFINMYGYTSHMGVCMGSLHDGKFIHSLKGTGSCMDSLHRYERMIDGFYRHMEHCK